VNELLVPRVVRNENVIVESSTLKDQEEEGSNLKNLDYKGSSSDAGMVSTGFINPELNDNP
jgi:hypothetical protein